MITEDMLARVGKAFKPHGFKGEINVELEYDFGPEDLAGTAAFFNIDGIPVPFRIESVRNGQKENFLLKFKEIDSDIEAVAVASKPMFFLKTDISRLLEIEEAEIDALEEGYIGFKVIDEYNKEVIGSVEDLEEGVEYDYLSVRKISDGELVSIPLIEEFIKDINVKEGENGGEIFVALPEGFLEI